MDHGSSDGAAQVNERLSVGDLGHQGYDANSGNFGNSTVPEHRVVIRLETLSNFDNLANQGPDQSLSNSGERGLPEAVIVIGSGNALDLSDQGNNTENLSNPEEQGVLKDVIVMRSENLASVSVEDEAKYAFGWRKGSIEEQKMNFAKGKDEKRSFISSIKCGNGDNWDGEKLCRICHLSPDQPSETASDAEMSLILLGCGCKGELCIGHRHCAEAWFKLKGNRVCEICGETAQNVTGIGDNRFIEEWNGRGSIGNETNASERVRRGWSGPPFCNLLIACLVIAFILPWFIRVKMF